MARATLSNALIQNIPVQVPVPLFREANSSIHGKGLFATVDIPPGALIHQEKPLFILLRGEYEIPSGVTAHSSWGEWLKLPLDGPPSPSSGDVLYDRFLATSLRCGVVLIGKQDVEISGAFVTATRFNHSCEPNVHAHWVPEEQQMYFRTLRQVKEGAELSICYDSGTLLFPKDTRKQKLLERFRFICNCVCCGLCTSDSDSRRLGLKSIVEGLAHTIPVQLRIQMINNAISSLRAEKLQMFADTLHYDLHLAKEEANDNNAVLCLLTARNLSRARVGENDQRVEDATKKLPENLRCDYGMTCRAGCCPSKQSGVDQLPLL